MGKSDQDGIDWVERTALALERRGLEQRLEQRWRRVSSVCGSLGAARPGRSESPGESLGICGKATGEGYCIARPGHDGDCSPMPPWGG